MYRGPGKSRVVPSPDTALFISQHANGTGQEGEQEAEVSLSVFSSFALTYKSDWRSVSAAERTAERRELDEIGICMLGGSLEGKGLKNKGCSG